MIRISKDKSLLIKGILIIMMIFLHLFIDNKTERCVNLLYIGDVPLVKWLTNACNTVGSFVLLSGYGLAYTFEKRGLDFLQQVKRILKLYMHYWVILITFIVIGCFLYADIYPGSLDRILLNMTGLKSDYNYEMWFLLPYTLIALTSKYIIKTIEKIGYVRSLLITAVINVGACYVISRHLFDFLADYHLGVIINYLQFLYQFTVGVTLYRSQFEVKWQLPLWLNLLIMTTAIAFVATINISITYIVYVPLMIFLFNQLSYPKWLEKVLIELGKKSMAMWMIHTWLCTYLFKDEVYSLKYPMLILITVVLLSYLLAIVFMWITKKCLWWQK